MYTFIFTYTYMCNVYINSLIFFSNYYFNFVKYISHQHTHIHTINIYKFINYNYHYDYNYYVSHYNYNYYDYYYYYNYEYNRNRNKETKKCITNDEIKKKQIYYVAKNNNCFIC